MNVLVTGGAGYIGSHTLVELLENKSIERVYSIDSLVNSSDHVYSQIEKITGKTVESSQFDLCDWDALAGWAEGKKIDGIIHFAALKAVGESVEKPLLYYQNNLSSLMHILKIMPALQTHHLVFSSSCSVYGNIAQLPVDENAPLMEVESPYANTKKIGEEIIQDVAKQYGKYIILRYFNPVGAHKSALIGEDPINKPNNLMPLICRAASGKQEITVFGDDYNTRDGSCIRDYIHVQDIARAHVQALEFAFTKQSKKIEVFNLGSGSGMSVLEMIESFQQVNGVSVPYSIGKRRSGDVEAIYSDSSKAKELLGWQPELGIEDIVESAWNWEVGKGKKLETRSEK